MSSNTMDRGTYALRLVLANLAAEGRMGDDQKVLDDIGDDLDTLRDALSFMAYFYAMELINQRGRDEANQYVMRLLGAGDDEET
jgi:hypothetical protein